MTKINTHFSLTNQQEAVNRASSSNRAAIAARTARDERNHILQILEEWSRIFTNSPIAILTALFVFAVLMEIFFSYPMYADLMSQMTGTGNILLSLVGAIFIVLWGAYVSHLLAKKLSTAVFNYTVYNEMRFSKNAVPHAKAHENARIATRKDFIKGLIFGFLLLVVVMAISWQRVWLLAVITGTDYSLTHKLLPVVCVLIEIISGIYIGYILRRLGKLRKANTLRKIFIREKSVCSYETGMMFEHHQHAAGNGEPLHYSNELREAFYRYEHRSQANDNYVDPIPELKTLKVVVADEIGLLPGIHLSGVLPDKEYCNSIVTNQQGEGVLTWDSEAKEVMVVYTDNERHLGPFRENSTIRLDLKRSKELNSA